ncbi:MAG TPA: YdeI/OmpD-associated family protein [Anaerolineaceae bacterium]|nr:YdeI/OmpD-associated family protein [Anaerolineaceae bacterium]HPN53214.1 YdeI/OmpD-associated family protein [Anaerolineaceae bacterium]
MGETHSFTAVIEDAGRGGAFVTIPFDVEAAFGKKRVKVKALIGGEPYRGSLVRMGGPCHILGIRKEIREKLGKAIGDAVEISLEEDEEERVMAAPEDVAQALANSPEAQAFFNRLSFTHQKEYLQWVEEAKREQTRQSRIEQMIALLKQGEKKR